MVKNFVKLSLTELNNMQVRIIKRTYPQEVKVQCWNSFHLKFKIKLINFLAQDEDHKILANGR